MTREAPWDVPLSTCILYPSTAVSSAILNLVGRFTRPMSRPPLKVGGSSMFVFLLRSNKYPCTTLVLPLSSDSCPGSHSRPSSLLWIQVLTLMQGNFRIQPHKGSPKMVFDSQSGISICFQCLCLYRGRTRTATATVSRRLKCVGRIALSICVSINRLLPRLRGFELSYSDKYQNAVGAPG